MSSNIHTNISMDNKIISTLLNSSLQQQFKKMAIKVLTHAGIYKGDQVFKEYNACDDDIIVSQLQKYVVRHSDEYSPEHSKIRGDSRWRFPIKDALRKNRISVKSYLDYGGGEGYMAEEIGKKLHLARENIHVVDVAEWSGRKFTPSEGVVFHEIGKNGSCSDLANIPDNSIDLITVFHVLHHVPVDQRESVLRSLNRVLSPNGLMILYEHDCMQNSLLSALIDMEHLFFDVIVAGNMSLHKFRETFYANYLPQQAWKSMFNKHEFKTVDVVNLNNKDKSFYAYLVKSKDVFTGEEATAADHAALELEKLLVTYSKDCDINVLSMWETDHFELEVASLKPINGDITNFMNYPVHYSTWSHCH